MTARATVLFPEPDSPTRPKIRPEGIASDTPWTACTGPRSVR